MTGAQVQHARARRAGVRVEVFTVLWMLLEVTVSVGAGIAAASLLLDRWPGQCDGVGQRRHPALVACGGSAGRESFTRGTCRASCSTTGRDRPDTAVCLRAGCSHLGGSSRRDLWLGLTKRRLAVRLDSGTLRGDAASSFTCAYMAIAATVLVGLVLHALWHWWWAENLAALVFLVWLVG